MLSYYLNLRNFRYYKLPFKRLNMTTEVDFAHDPIFLAGTTINMKYKGLS